MMLVERETPPSKRDEIESKILYTWRSIVPGQHRISGDLISRLRAYVTSESSMANLDNLNKLLILYRSSSFIFHLITLASAFVIVIEQSGTHIGEEWVLLASYIAFLLSREIDFYFRNRSQEVIKTNLLAILTDIIHGRAAELKSFKSSTGAPSEYIAEITARIADAERSGFSILMELALPGLALGGGLFVTANYSELMTMVATTTVFWPLFHFFENRLLKQKKRNERERFEHAAKSGQVNVKPVENTSLSQNESQWARTCMMYNLVVKLTRSVLPLLSIIQPDSSKARLLLILSNLYFDLVIGFFYNRRDAVISLTQLDILELLLDHLDLRVLTMTDLAWIELREQGLEQSQLEDNVDRGEASYLTIQKITCQNLRSNGKCYLPLLKSDTLKMQLGRVHHIVGERGFGKSMFCQQVSQELLHEPSEQVWVGNKNLYECTTLEEVRQEIKYYPCADTHEHSEYSGVVSSCFDTAFYHRPHSVLNDFYDCAVANDEINASYEIQEVVRAALKSDQSYKVAEIETSQGRQIAALRDWILFQSSDGEKELKEHERSFFAQAKQSLQEAKLWRLRVFINSELAFFSEEETYGIINSNFEELSPGQRSLIAVAIAFAENPRVIILDEAYSRLSQTSQQDNTTIASNIMVTLAINRYCRDGGTLMLISHQDQDIRRTQFSEDIRGDIFSVSDNRISLMEDEQEVDALRIGGEA